MKATAICALTTFTLCATPAIAFPIAAPGTEGLSVVVTSADHVFATYEGNSASYSNDLYLGDRFVFNNQTTPVGTTVDLGSFAVDTELVFRLFVNNTGYSYSTGPASRNPDGHAHARVQGDWAPSATLVSFEDLFDGPFDYNDLSFSFSNTVGASVPEASSFLMLALGAGWLMIRSRSNLRALRKPSYDLHFTDTR